jgi:hypothetical protein
MTISELGDACMTSAVDSVSPRAYGLEGAALSNHGAQEGVFAAQSDGVEVADDDAVRMPERGAGVGDTLGRAVGGHERLRFT